MAALLVGLALVALALWIGSSIPRNSGWQEPDRGVTIMVESNGIHTAIVMPLIASGKDWRSDFPTAGVADPDRAYSHVSVSWGEREVFLNTPTWSDISLTTVLNAATGGEGLIHVAHYVRPAPSPDIRTLTVSEPQYARLVAAIERQLPPPDKRETFSGYGDYDVFYTARGTYHLGNTCNQWTSDRFAEAGIKTGWLTPLPGGVMKWVATDS